MRALAILVLKALLAPCLAAALLPQARAQEGALPVFRAVLAWRAGQLVVDPARSMLDLGSRSQVFRDCGLSDEAIRAELVAILDGNLRALGPAFERLVLPPATEPEGIARRAEVEQAFRALAARDAATQELLRLDGDWAQGQAKILDWWRTHRADTPLVAVSQPLVSALYKAVEFQAALADGPLLPVRTERDENPDAALFARGEIRFQLAPPLVGTDSRLRPVSNVAQWDALREGLSAQALRPLQCRLWKRQQVVDKVQDYLEVRGIVVQPYRNRREDEEKTGLDPLPPQPPPEDHAGISPERPRFAGDGSFGGRVLLLPDPLVRQVFVETGPRGASALWPALYLLLPSTDLHRVRAQPGDFLCRTPAIWKAPVAGQPLPQAVRLDLDAGPGASLQFSRLYLTPREVALRLQRLASVQSQAGIRFTADDPDKRKRLRWTSLIVEPQDDAAPAPATGAPLDARIRDCTETAAPAAAAPAAPPAPLPDPAAADHVQAAPMHPARRRPEPLRNEVLFAVEKPAGQPLLLGATYSHQGLQPGDRFRIGFGHQRRGSTEAGYSSDFVAFDSLRHRLQLDAGAYSTAQPDRPQPAGTRSDERREGADLRATVDLWRDVAGSFGQAALTLSRVRTTPAGSDDALPEVTLAGLALTVARDRSGTSDAPHGEALLALARGRSAGRGFGKGSLELGWQQFIGAFERVDLRLRSAAVGAAAPLSERVPFGGDESVRGYASDRRLVQRATTLQAEVWLPLPWAPASETVARVLRRNVALAFFTDIGRAGPAGPDGQRLIAGAGVGLRYTQAQGVPLTLKLDLAHPLRVDGALAASDRRLRVHFAVSVQQAL